MKGNDPLGDRMKADYENRTRIYLPRRTYTLLRCDGKSFHTFTRGFERPFDLSLMGFMDATAKALCERIEGARCAFVQSDEITVLMTDFEYNGTEAWFDNNLQKICSVSASIATAAFNQAYISESLRKRITVDEGNIADYVDSLPFAQFDCRVWQIPQRIEVYNAFLWRQNDATRNAVSMAANAHFSHNSLQGKSTGEMQEMLFQEKGINFNDYPAGFKRGRFVEKVTRVGDVEYVDKRTNKLGVAENVTRGFWEVTTPPTFSTPEGREWLLEHIPVNQ